MTKAFKRPFNCALGLALLASTSLLSQNPAHAAGAYSEDFTDGLAQSWAGTTSATWLVSTSATHGSVYGNTSESENQANLLAVYNGNTWSSDYTYSARVYSTHGSAQAPGSTANRVGLVFNYQDANNYHRVLVSMQGKVVLEKVTGGTASDVAPFTTVTGVDDEIPFNIEVALRGSQISVRVNGQQAYSNVAITGLATAKIGVISQYNIVWIDNITVTPVANALFRTGFDGATVNPTTFCGGGLCQQTITGTDPNTNFSWPIQIWDLTSSHLHAITARDDVTPATLPDAIRNEIQTVPGPNGQNTKVLYQSIRKSGNIQGMEPQTPYYIFNPSGTSTAAQQRLYIRMWMKLGTDSGLGSWRVLTQWKSDGDFRLNLRTTTYPEITDRPTNCTGNGSTFWHLFADNVANGGLQRHVFWEQCQKTLPVPHGAWFKVEFFFDRGSVNGTNGRAWAAINGQQIFNVVGETMWGVHSTKINRLMIPSLYTGEDAGPGNFVEQWVDDLEIWDDFPADASPH